MHTACDYAAYDCPVLGINLGHLGFLTAAERNGALPAVAALVEGRCRVEERMMLEGRVASLATNSVVLALNDIVFGSGTKMASFDVKIASQTLAFRADGIIIATSTGSTAYNASAFGPLIDPAVDCMILNIRAPQPLPFPPVVVHPSRTLEMQRYLRQHRLADPRRPDRPAAGPRRAGEIRASTLRAKLVRLPENDFYETLNVKFNLPLRTATVQ